jgi:hypothetical protein
MAGVSGAHVGQHETFYAGNTKVGTVVCCPCCERGEGQSATFLTLCAIHNQLLP